jgi:hypothetical protein
VASPSAVRALSGIVTKQFMTVALSATAAVVLAAVLAAATDEELAIVVFENCTADAEEMRVERKRTVEVKLAMFAAMTMSERRTSSPKECMLTSNERVILDQP